MLCLISVHSSPPEYLSVFWLLSPASHFLLSLQWYARRTTQVWQSHVSILMGMQTMLVLRFVIWFSICILFAGLGFFPLKCKYLNMGLPIFVLRYDHISEISAKSCKLKRFIANSVWVTLYNNSKWIITY